MSSAMNTVSGIAGQAAEGLGNVMGSVAKGVVGLGGSVVSSVTGGGPGGAVSAPEYFSVTLDSVTIDAIGEQKIDSFRPIVAFTIREHDFSARQKEKSQGTFALRTPLAFAKNSFNLQASLTSETLCIEIWEDKMVDKFEARACIPLSLLASLEGGGKGRQQVEVDLPDVGCCPDTVVHAMLGSQHPQPGFKARARLTLTRTQPGALVYAAPGNGNPDAAKAEAPTTTPVNPPPLTQ